MVAWATLEVIIMQTIRTLSVSYLAYFAVLGAFVPYIGMFLDHRGLNSAQIGTLLALVTGMRIIGPNLWGLLAARRNDPVGVMRLGAMLATLGWCSTFVDYGYWALLLGLALYSLCWTAILPQLESAAFHFLQNDTARYSKVRSGGSVGYILLVVGSGVALEHYGAGFLPYGALLFLLLMLAALWQLPSYQPQRGAQDVPLFRFRNLWRHRGFVAFMAAAFLLQVSFAPFYSFFTLYCRDLGYSGTSSGLLIALAVAAEIIAFYFAGKIIGQRALGQVLLWCYLLTAVRWLLTGWLGHHPWVLAASMLLHAFSFAIAHSCAMQFIQQFFQAAERGRGQALYAGLIYGGGGALGAYLAGQSWQDGQGAALTFSWAAACCVVAALLVAWQARPQASIAAD